MIDTLAITGRFPLEKALPAGKISRCGVLRVKVAAEGDCVTSVEGSLPRVVWGHNGRLIQDQDQLNDGLEAMRSALARWGVNAGRVEDWQATRVDLVWNYKLGVKSLPGLMMAHAPLRVRGVLKSGTLHPDGEGVSWRGEKSRFLLRLYFKDKDVLRAELSLRGKQIKRRTRGNWRDFSADYDAYRKVMVSIPAIRKPVDHTSLTRALSAFVASKGLADEAVAFIAETVKDRTLRNFRREMSATASGVPEKFAWEDILPPTGPPPPVNVEPRKRSRRQSASVPDAPGYRPSQPISGPIPVPLTESAVPAAPTAPSEDLR